MSKDNVDAPNGFTPVRMISGAPWNGQSVRFSVDASNGGTIAKGDLIALQDDGNVTRAAAGETAIGVCVGVQVVGVTDDNFLESGQLAEEEHPGYLPASTAGEILIAVGSDVVYECQGDEDTTPLGAGNIGDYVDITDGAANATTGRSTQELDSDTASRTVNATLRIVGKAERPGNDVGSNFATYLVTLNESGITGSEAADNIA